MRIFYAFWFFFCAGWGYLLPTFPHEEGDSALNVLVTFPVAVLFSALLTFFALRSESVPADNAHLNIDLKPWQKPLGIVQFVTVTFIFSAVWGIGFSMPSQDANVFRPLWVLALAAGGLLGTWAACRVYRSTHVA